MQCQRKIISEIKTVNQHFSKWSFQRFIKWLFQTVILNDHLSLHAIKTGQNLILFHFIYDQFFNFSIFFFFFQIPRSKHSKTIADVHRIEKITNKIKKIKKKNHKRWKWTINQNAKNQKSDMLIWWNMKIFFRFQKNVSVDTIKYSFSWRVIYV